MIDEFGGYPGAVGDSVSPTTANLGGGPGEGGVDPFGGYPGATSEKASMSPKTKAMLMSIAKGLQGDASSGGLSGMGAGAPGGGAAGLSKVGVTGASGYSPTFSGLIDRLARSGARPGSV